MTEKDLQELIRIRMGIDAMRKQIIKDLDAMATQIEILLPTPQEDYSNDWRGKHGQ